MQQLSDSPAMGLKEWGNAKSLPGGYTLNASCGDTTYYQPIPLRYLRSVEMEGHTGVSGTISIHGVQACCCGLCGICGVSQTIHKRSVIPSLWTLNDVIFSLKKLQINRMIDTKIINSIIMIYPQ